MEIKLSKKTVLFFKNFQKSKYSLIVVGLLLIAVFILGINFSKLTNKEIKTTEKISSQPTVSTSTLEALQAKVLPEKGYVFKIKWGDLGKRMIEDGVIDETKLANALTGTDKLPENYKKYFDGSDQQIKLTQDSSQFWVDILWGLGLANKNRILDEGPMVEGGNTANFASTGGYTIGAKAPMELYGKFSYITLSEKQQEMVKEIAGNIYRPCCGNSTAFPDCNHGMAALALVELMVSQNFSKDEIYKTVLAFNSYWFPQTYLDIAYHFSKNNRDYGKVPAMEVLSKTFSSAAGYQAIKKQLGDVPWPALKGGRGCGA